eukprot:scaffold98380_cov75-Phaeocystis_antarctica.AAC.4
MRPGVARPLTVRGAVLHLDELDGTSCIRRQLALMGVEERLERGVVGVCKVLVRAELEWVDGRTAHHPERPAVSRRWHPERKHGTTFVGSPLDARARARRRKPSCFTSGMMLENGSQQTISRAPPGNKPTCRP